MSLSVIADLTQRLVAFSLADLLVASQSHRLRACKLSAGLAFLPQLPRQGEAVLGTGDLQDPHKTESSLSCIIRAWQALFGKTSTLAQRLPSVPMTLGETGIPGSSGSVTGTAYVKQIVTFICVSLVYWIGVLLKYFF